MCFWVSRCMSSTNRPFSESSFVLRSSLWRRLSSRASSLSCSRRRSVASSTASRSKRTKSISWDGRFLRLHERNGFD